MNLIGRPRLDYINLKRSEMQDISDEVLIKAAQGDLEAFDQVYKAACVFVYNVAYRVVQHKEEAQEVTQEVFITLHKKLKDFRFQSSFKTWVYRVTTNCAINHVKKISKERNRRVDYDDNLEIPTAEVEMDIDKEDRKERINELLKVLNPEQRACIVLRNIEGLSYEEIARALEININTVRSRLKRAREKLLALGKKVAYEDV